MSFQFGPKKLQLSISHRAVKAENSALQFSLQHRDEQDSQIVHMGHGRLVGSHILVSITVLRLHSTLITTQAHGYDVQRVSDSFECYKYKYL